MVISQTHYKAGEWFEFTPANTHHQNSNWENSVPMTDAYHLQCTLANSGKRQAVCRLLPMLSDPILLTAESKSMSLGFGFVWGDFCLFRFVFVKLRTPFWSY